MRQLARFRWRVKKVLRLGEFWVATTNLFVRKFNFEFRWSLENLLQTKAAFTVWLDLVIFYGSLSINMGINPEVLYLSLQPVCVALSSSVGSCGLTRALLICCTLSIFSRNSEMAISSIKCLYGTLLRTCISDPYHSLSVGNHAATIGEIIDMDFIKDQMIGKSAKSLLQI